MVASTQTLEETSGVGRQSRVLMTIDLELTKQEREGEQIKSGPAAFISRLARKITLT